MHWCRDALTFWVQAGAMVLFALALWVAASVVAMVALAWWVFTGPGRMITKRGAR